MEVVFYTLQKKVNSTKRPSENGVTVNCVYKNPTSIYSPTLILSYSNFNYNYCKIDNRYYYINNIVALKNDVFEIYCDCDILATAISDIIDMEVYAVYGDLKGVSSIKYPKSVADSRATYTSEFDRKTITHSMGWFQSGAYRNLITTSGKGADGNTFTTTYILKDSEMIQLNNLLNDGSVWEELKQQFYEPMNSVISSYRLPIGIENYFGHDTDGNLNMPNYCEKDFLFLGAYNTDMVCWKYKDNAIELNNEYTVDIPITIPFYSGIYNDYLNLSPYSKYSIYIPFFGLYELNNAVGNPIGVRDKNTLKIRMNLLNGELIAFLVDDTNTILQTFQGNCGEQIALSNQQNGLTKVGNITSAIGSVVSLIKGQSPIANVSALVNSIDGIVTTTQSNNGTASSLIGTNINGLNINVSRETRICRFPLNMGKPIFSTIKLNEIDGYIQTDKSHVYSENLTHEENERLNTIFNGGVYIDV